MITLKVLLKSSTFRIVRWKMSINNFIISKNNYNIVIAKDIITHLKTVETQFWKHFLSNFDFKKLS